MRALKLRAHHSLERRRAALRVAERERRNPWQLTGNREREHSGAPWQHGRPLSNECPRDPVDDTQERARQVEGDQAKRDLERQADQEAGFEGRLEGRGFSVSETLDQLLHTERERRQ